MLLVPEMNCDGDHLDWLKLRAGVIVHKTLMWSIVSAQTMSLSKTPTQNRILPWTKMETGFVDEDFVLV